jgi:prepilin-type N-terminal cleavage/methylation domain-containing protein
MGNLTRSASQKKRARGYTAVEVLMGMTLLSIGAAAVISMQRGAVQANLEARKLDMANAIAREWVERLRRDATLWTLPSAINSVGNNYANAKLLSTYLQYGNTTANSNWSYPDIYLQTAAAPDGVSIGFDILGRDLAVTDIQGSSTKPSAAVFCVHVRLNWLVVNSLIRAEVRVVWPRLIDQGANTVDWCSKGNSDAITGDTNHYHFVYAATAIRQNPAQ